MVDFGTFFLDGKNAKNFGIVLRKQIEVSAVKPIIDSVKVPGRNGDILYDTGAFSNRTIKAPCFVLKKKAADHLFALNSFLMQSTGYRKLEISDLPNHFFMARVINGADFSIRSKILAPFNISFDCKPQAFLNSGQKYIDISERKKIINNPGTGHAKPLIHVQGTGSGVVTIAGKSIYIDDIQGDLMLDCETQTAYWADQNRNSSISCEEFPQMYAGSNWVSTEGGVTLLRIMPRWFDL